MYILTQKKVILTMSHPQKYEINIRLDPSIY